MKYALVLVLAACGGGGGGTDAGSDGGGIPFVPPPTFAPCTGTLGFPGLPGVATQNVASNLVAADLDGDGVPELVVLDGTVAVAHGLGNGLYAPLVRYAVPTSTALVGLAVGDLDGDGKPDIATTTQLSGTSFAIEVLHNKGDGTFAAPTSVATTARGVRVAIADLDGDTHNDLVMADDAGNAEVFLRAQSGFAAEQDTAGAGGFVAVADVVGDSKLDLVTPTQIFANAGAGTFGAPTTFNTTVTATAVVVADFTGDTKPDIAVAGGGTPHAAVFVNTGSGFTESDLLVAPSAAAVQLAAADVDGDHAIDLVEIAGDAYVYKNNGDATFAAPFAMPAAATPSAIAALDLDGDGAIDLATAGGGIDLLRGDGHGAFEARDRVVAVTTAAANPGALIGDATGDGKPDLIYADATRVRVLPNLGNRAYGEAIETSLGTALTHAQLVDVDGDGKLDIIAGTTGGVEIAYGQGDGTFAATTVPIGFDVTHLAVGDLDGDGKPDLAAHTGGQVVTVVLNQGNRQFGDNIPLETAANPDSLVINGHALFASDQAAASVLVGTLQNGKLVVFGAYSGRAAGIGFADVDHDGIADLVARGVDVVITLHGHGDDTFDAGTLHSLPGPASAMTLADLDGDGDSDVVVASTASLVTAHGGGGAFGTPSPYIFALATDDAAFALGDLDGDGRPDLVAPEGDGSALAIRYGSCR